ncbi:hypothetical protein L210DRAFT_3101650 [Boletus edulis BED1]|uniref:Uncharacterized protein n=1 Tax=Boletus edulis BED1 TaxID=1328754 RepID=A0AAD4C072_BOLED|nr:hypothetical protein L210DRAFT_3101650 [Boletus edulis BED1]
MESIQPAVSVLKLSAFVHLTVQPRTYDGSMKNTISVPGSILTSLTESALLTCIRLHIGTTLLLYQPVSKRTSVAGEENNVQLRHIDPLHQQRQCLGAWVRGDKPNGCIWSRYVEKGGIKYLYEWLCYVRGIETHERGGIRALLIVVFTDNIVFQMIYILRLSVMYFHGQWQRAYHTTTALGSRVRFGELAAVAADATVRVIHNEYSRGRYNHR